MKTSFAVQRQWMLCISVFLTSMKLETRAENELAGHLQKLGSHRPADQAVSSIWHTPAAEDFYERYVSRSMPVILKGAMKTSPAFPNWTDEYLRKKFGQTEFEVDLNKVDDRLARTTVMRLSRFLEIYQLTDTYLVQTVPMAMRAELDLLPCLRCGGFLHNLQDVVMWFSAGGTKSKLHLDTVENLNCLISGTKEWFFVHPDHRNLISLDRTASDFSSVDVDRVNMLESPGLAQVPWWSAVTQAGDCIYVPHQWIHQVNSFQRNLAVNIWWTPMQSFNKSDCQDKVFADGVSSLDQFPFIPGEQIRYFLRQMVQKHDGKLTFNQIHKLLLNEHTGEHLVSARSFSSLDHNGDGLLTLDDVELLPARVLSDAVDAPPGDINTVGQSQKAFSPGVQSVKETWLDDENDADDQKRDEGPEGKLNQKKHLRDKMQMKEEL